MGRLVVPVVLVYGEKSVRTEAKVDTGADQTLITISDAERLGIDVCKGELQTVGGLGGGKVAGRVFDIEIWAAERRAVVRILVPTHRMVSSTDRQTGKETVTFVAATRTQNLLGHDFLQDAKSKIDYSKPHNEVLSGMKADGTPIPSDNPDVFELATITPAERKAYEKQMRKDYKCKKRKQ
ncbi:MAG: aspartyl protease family protein [Elusimicrobiota bacterium]|jgi:hypothetical protein